MSSIQKTLADVQSDSVDDKDVESDEGPAWTPGETTSSNECLNCGSHVSASFVRTHSDQNGDVHACVECVPQNKVKWLAAGLRPRVGGALR